MHWHLLCQRVYLYLMYFAFISERNGDMLFANLWKAIILGIIEGITEWLPISSTGHLILVDEFIKLDLSKDFMEMFNVVINWEQLWRLLFYTSTN